MNIRSIIIVCTISLCILIMMSGKTSASKAPLTHAQIVAVAQHEMHIMYGWANSPWTGNDAPFEQLRTKIDQEATNGAKAEAIADQYHKALLKTPSDINTRFAYYYANYLAATLPGGQDSMEDQIIMSNQIENGLTRNPQYFPHTYNYARLMFLSDILTFTDPKLIDLGFRLVQKNPNDFPVVYDYDEALNANNNPADQAKALSLAQQLITRYPDKPAVYKELASVYYNSWFWNKRLSEAALSIAEYQKYLSMIPANSTDRPDIEGLIARMNKDSSPNP